MPAISIPAATVADSGRQQRRSAHRVPGRQGLSLQDSAGRPAVCGAVIGWGQLCAMGSQSDGFSRGLRFLTGAAAALPGC